MIVCYRCAISDKDQMLNICLIGVCHGWPNEPVHCAPMCIDSLLVVPLVCHEVQTVDACMVAGCVTAWDSAYASPGGGVDCGCIVHHDNWV